MSSDSNNEFSDILSSRINHVGSFIPKKTPQYLAALAATAGAFGLGNAIGWSSFGLKSMVNSTAFPDFDDKSDDATWIASVMNLGALAAGLTVGFALNTFGRKWTMLGLSVPFVAGWLIMGFAKSVALMIVGRFITGFCGGAFTLCCPVYTSEIAQREIRGVLGNMLNVLLCFGILFSYIVGALVDYDHLSFVCAGVPVVALITLLFIPESPHYLLTKGREQEAKQALKKLRGAEYDEQVEDELKLINKSIHESNMESASFKDLLEGPIFKPTAICMVLQFLQQFSGINAVLFFSKDIFEAANTGLNDDYQSIAIGVTQVAFVIVSTLLIERLGRKVLLTVSAAGMFIGLAALGVFFYLQEEEDKASNLGWLPITSLVFYIITYNLGYGPLPWTMMGELIPPRVKGLSSSMATACSWGLSFVITKSFPSMRTTMHSYGCFWFFSAICLAGTVFSLLGVPETKGKSLDELQRLFKK